MDVLYSMLRNVFIFFVVSYPEQAMSIDVFKLWIVNEKASIQLSK